MHHIIFLPESCCTWCGDRGPGEGDVEGRLVSQIHPPADEESCSAAEQHPHHQQHPEGKTKLRPSTGISICAETLHSPEAGRRIGSD